MSRGDALPGVLGGLDVVEGRRGDRTREGDDLWRGFGLQESGCPNANLQRESCRECCAKRLEFAVVPTMLGVLR